MTTTVRGLLGQLAISDGEVIGVIRRIDDNSIMFFHVPAEVTARVGELLAPEAVVELTGYQCDHERYLVVTGVVRDEYEQQCEACRGPFEAREPTSHCPACEAV